MISSKRTWSYWYKEHFHQLGLPWYWFCQFSLSFTVILAWYHAINVFFFFLPPFIHDRWNNSDTFINQMLVLSSAFFFASIIDTGLTNHVLFFDKKLDFIKAWRLKVEYKNIMEYKETITRLGLIKQILSRPNLE